MCPLFETINAEIVADIKDSSAARHFDRQTLAVIWFFPSLGRWYSGAPRPCQEVLDIASMPHVPSRRIA